MIDAVEVMYEEEQQAIEESYSWERIRASLRHLLCEVDDERRDTIRNTGDKNTPEYDKLELMLGHVEDYVMGRIEELNPGSYQFDSEFHYGLTRSERENLQYALQERINAVALQSLPRKYHRDAIEYISERGLASMNYESTCRAVSEYKAERLGLRRVH